MGKTILTSAQSTALRVVMSEPNLASFHLSGGTALAEYYFQHRLSEDLDFFSAEKPDGLFLLGFVQKVAQAIGASSVRHEQVYDRRLFFFQQQESELKIEFTQYPFPALDPLEQKEGVRVESLRDIAANKLAALLDRFEPKDFVDMYVLLQRFSLADICRDTEQKFGLKISALFLGSELAKVSRIEALPHMLIPLTVDELKSFFTEQAKLLRGEVLDT